MAARIPSRHREKPPHAHDTDFTNESHQGKDEAIRRTVGKRTVGPGRSKERTVGRGGEEGFEGVSVGGRDLIPTRREEAKNHLSKKETKK